MEKHFFYELLERYFDGSATPDEKKLVEAYYEQLSTEEAAFSEEKKMLIKDQILRNIYNDTHPLRPIRRRRLKRWVVAASLIGLLGLGYWLYVLTGSVRNNPAELATVDNDINPPASNSAIITFANGQQLKLADLENGMKLKEGQVSVIKKAADEIHYDNPAKADGSPIQYNVLSNPRKSGIVAITLSDGTKAWLNSESSLRYPVSFNSEFREVEVTGEVYFEVARDVKHRFIVNGKGFRTEVLGTHFNANSYRDDGMVNITLLEGSVKVYGSDPDRDGIKLKPGEQAAVDGSVAISRNVDLDEVMAWKNGLFKFNKVGIDIVMKQLERWFDLDVKYQGSIPNFQFVGELSRSLSLLKVLTILEKSGVKFKLEGKTLTVI